MIAATDNRPTLRELFDLPESVGQNDFVLKLAEAIRQPEATVSSYVVTEQLAKCFDEALALARDAVTAHKSRAAYLHGSFGAGKSHFMAMLHLLLSGDVRARSVPELASVVAKHSEWTASRKFLLVPYHMIGADTVEERVLGGYVDHIAQLHPEAPAPGVYRADSLIHDARQFRASLGDPEFFRKLNESAEADEWEQLSDRWTPETFEHAASARPNSDDRSALVGAIVRNLITSARQNAEFVDLDTGLSLISKHARSLGYGALILFLDELILWLATRSADTAWLNREGPKIAKLVESEKADRPAPIISFVARQRALKSLIGKATLGAEQDLVEHALEWWEGRFATITIEDANLARIIRKRLLKPRSEAAAQLIAGEFERTRGLQNTILDVLVTDRSNHDQFREMYPLTPVLVDTLVQISAALQRDRTALRVLAQILVAQQDTMRLGDLVAFGELWTVLRDGYEPFHSDMKLHFENARKLWDRRLRPIIEREVGAGYDQLESLPPGDGRVRQLRVQERVAGTLIVSALAPELESLQALTGRRIAALNFGTIRTQIPGTEGAEVERLCRRWAAECGDVRINPTSPATISVQLTGVDVQSILDGAKHEDSHGNRLRKAADLLLTELGLDPVQQYPITVDLTWKAVKRTAELKILNVREAGWDDLRPTRDCWRLNVYWPLDRDNHTPADALAQIETLVHRNPEPVRALVWLPSFLSERARADLGRLAILDYVLKNDKLKEYSRHLSAMEREQARGILENMRRELEIRSRNALRQAYGASVKIEPGVLDDAHRLEPAQQAQSLDRAFELRPISAPDLKSAMETLFKQALEYELPGHPDFKDDELTLNINVTRRAWAEMEAAIRDPENRKSADKKVRNEIRPLLEPLDLAHVGEQFVVPIRESTTRFERRIVPGSPVTVKLLRQWIDEPKKMGLPAYVQDLIILTFAGQTNRSFRAPYGPAAPDIGHLKDDWTLEQQELPDKDTWDKACLNAANILGVPGFPICTASNLDSFFTDVQKLVTEFDAPYARLLELMRSLQTAPGVAAGNDANRLVTARAVSALLASLKAAKKPIDCVRQLAGANIATSDTAMARSLKSAPDLVAVMEHLKWTLLSSVARITDGQRAEAARIIFDRLRDAFSNDEYVTPLKPALHQAEDAATRLLVEQPPAPPVVTPPTPPPLPPDIKVPIVPGPVRPPVAKRVVASGKKTAPGRDFDRIVEEIRRELEQAGDAEIDITWEIRR